MIELVDQHPGLRLLLLVSGEINERSKILDDIAALVPNRADEEGRPELAAVLAAIEDFRAAVRTALELGLDLRQRLASASCAIRKLKLWPRTSSRAYPVRREKASLAKMMGLPGSFASVNTMAIRVVSAATTNGPRSFLKALDFGFGVLLLLGLAYCFRHALLDPPVTANAAMHRNNPYPSFQRTLTQMVLRKAQGHSISHVAPMPMPAINCIDPSQGR